MYLINWQRTRFSVLDRKKTVHYFCPKQCPRHGYFSEGAEFISFTCDSFLLCQPINNREISSEEEKMNLTDRGF